MKTFLVSVVIILAMTSAIFALAATPAIFPDVDVPTMTTHNNLDLRFRNDSTSKANQFRNITGKLDKGGGGGVSGAENIGSVVGQIQSAGVFDSMSGLTMRLKNVVTLSGGYLNIQALPGGPLQIAVNTSVFSTGGNYLPAPNGSHKLDNSWLQATRTPTAGWIPIADASGKLDSWVTNSATTCLQLAGGAMTGPIRGGQSATFGNMTTGDQWMHGVHFGLATSIPIAGAYNRGDVLYNSNPRSGGYSYWKCVAGSSPGPMSWEGFGLITPAATTYYVDPANGSDSYTGTDSSHAWQTVARVNAAFFRPNDRVLFVRGGTWREQLTVPSSGTSNQPITFGAYGSGAQPIITGTNVITGWIQAPATWTAVWDSTVQIGNSTWLSAGFSNYNYRSYVKGTTITGNATIIRVSFEPSPTAGQNMNIDSITIGPKATTPQVYDFTTTPTRLTYQGSNTFTASGAGSVIYCDPVPFTLTQNTDYLIAVHGGSNNYAGKLSGTGTNQWYLSGNDDTTTVQTSGYTGYTASLPAYQIQSAATYYTNVYQVPLATQPYVVFFNGVKGTNQSSVAALASDNDWYWSAGNLYVYSTTAPSGKTVEAAQRNYAIYNTHDYVTVDNITASGTNSVGIYMNGGAGNTVQNSTVKYAYASSSTAGILVTGVNGVATGNTVDSIKGAGVEFTGSGGIISHNTITNAWNGSAYGSGGFGPGIEATSGANGTVIKYNYVSGCYEGIRDDGALNTFVYYNLVLNSMVNDITHYNGTAVAPVLIFNNTVIHNPTYTSGHGIAANSGGTGADGFVAENNIVYSSYTGTNVDVELMAIAASNYTSVVVDNNLYYLAPGSTCGVGLLTTTQYNTLAAWQTALNGTSYTGKDAHAVSSDPKFVNAASDYHLQATSPAIDAGANVGLHNDYDGTSVPQGAGPDIGSYEYH